MSIVYLADPVLPTPLFRFVWICLIAVANNIIGMLASKVIYRYASQICWKSF